MSARGSRQLSDVVTPCSRLPSGGPSSTGHFSLLNSHFRGFYSPQTSFWPSFATSTSGKGCLITLNAAMAKMPMTTVTTSTRALARRMAIWRVLHFLLPTSTRRWWLRSLAATTLHWRPLSGVKAPHRTRHMKVADRPGFLLCRWQATGTSLILSFYRHRMQSSVEISPPRRNPRLAATRHSPPCGRQVATGQ